jgi:peptidoglycan/LPS O-acetylase OafA/YrhL
MKAPHTARLVELDALRGIFAMGIVLLHSPFLSAVTQNAIVRHFYIFVDFFFVLSGFVVSMSYMERLERQRSLAHFLILRVGRLWPLHAFVLIMFLMLYFLRFVLNGSGPLAQDPQNILGLFFGDIFFLNGFRNGTTWLLNFPAWSINAEMVSYVVFGVFAAYLAGRSAKYSIPLIASGLVVYGLYDPPFGATWNWSIFRSTYYFMIGLYCYKIRASVPQIRFNTILESSSILALVGYFTSFEWLGGNILRTFVFSFVILVFSYGGGWISTILRGHFFQVLGRRSYSIYMIHVFVFSLMSYAAGKMGLLVHSGSAEMRARFIYLGEFTNVALLISLFAIIFLAGLSYRFVEVPGQDVAKRFARRRLSARVDAQGG